MNQEKQGSIAQSVERRFEAPGALVQFQFGPPEFSLNELDYEV